MLSPSQLHGYQQKAVNFQCTHPSSALWLDMGLGKTAVTLTSIAHMLSVKYLKAVVIVAPIRVCRLVWRQEAAKWNHTKDLRFSMVTGTRDQRTRALMRPDTDIFLINYENLGWLSETLNTYYISKKKEVPFDGVVFDEISKCFPAGTMITGENSDIAIDKLKIGDKVMTHLGLRSITDVMVSQSEHLVSVHLSNGRTLKCTVDHPVLLNEQWVEAGTLSVGDMLYEFPERTLDSQIRSRGLSDLRDGLLETKGRTVHMFKTLCEYMANAATGSKTSDNGWGNKGVAKTQRTTRNMEQGVGMVGRSSHEDKSVPQEVRSFSLDWRKRNGGVLVGEPAENCVTSEIHTGIYLQDAVSSTGLPDSLQDRLRRPTGENRYRGARNFTSHDIGETKGLEKTRVLGKVRVESVVHHERTNSVDVWNITVEEAETYFASGVLVHNCKNSTTDRVKSLMKVIHHFKWRTGLTGTPASNGYQDLHGQFLVLDGGQRLGKSKTAFKTRFYRKVGPHKEVPFDDTETTIKNLIGDMTLEMSAEDYNPLPDLIVNDVVVDMSDDVRTAYEKMEKEFFLRLDNGTEMEMFNQASLMNKALQYSNGAVYPVAGMPLWEPIHDEKLDALEEIIDENEGKPVLVSYAFRSDAERIMQRFKHLDPINLTECKSEHALNTAMYRWKNNKCQLMIGHPASMGHGVDGLQSCGNTLVWFGLNWSLDLYEQFNARLRRQGQGVPVICHRILCKDTLDQAQAEALNDKATNQQSIRKAVKNYRENKSQTV